MKCAKSNGKIFLYLFCLLLFFFCVEVDAQTIKAQNVSYIPDVEAIFSKGINEYRSGDFGRATQTFEELLNNYPVHQRITAVHIMLGKCYYKTRENQKGITALEDLIKKYPTSNYIDDAHYTLGFFMYQMENYIASLKEFLFVADHGKDKKLVERSRGLSLKIIDNNLTLNEIQQLKDSLTGESSIAILTIKLSQRMLDQGERDRAIATLQNFVQQQSKNQYLATVKEMLKRANISVPLEEATIGVILPLSGEYTEQAKAVLAGIMYAQRKFNNQSEVKINLVVKDSEGDMVKLVRSAQELANDKRIIAIIGELEQDKTVAIAAVLNNTNIPLIAPTTSGNGVTSLNEYAFQMNSDTENRGRILAQYAIEQLGLKTFATLAPADNYGKDMTDSFTATVDQLGGKIVAQKWYYTNTQDLKRQFQSIRELGLEMQPKEPYRPLSTKEKDLEAIPVTSIDGILFPCYSEEIQYIAPQFAFANIKAQIIGGEHWYDMDKLRTSQNYIEGIIFCSGYYFDETNTDFIKFRNDFRNVMKRTPEVMESYGYDAMRVVIDAVAHRQLTREDVRNYLNNVENFPGLRGPLTFKGNNRVNAQVRILTFKNGRIEPLK